MYKLQRLESEAIHQEEMLLVLCSGLKVSKCNNAQIACVANKWPVFGHIGKTLTTDFVTSLLVVNLRVHKVHMIY